MECRRAVVLALFLFFGLALGEVVKISKCHVPTGQKANCNIHEVRIEPCPEAAENKPCKIQLGSNATMTFDYTPTWNAEKAGSMAYKVGSLTDIAFENMDSDGCKYTKCPIEANKKQTYAYTLTVLKQFPVALYQVKWTLYNEPDYKQKCCFKFGIQLIP